MTQQDRSELAVRLLGLLLLVFALRQAGVWALQIDVLHWVSGAYVAGRCSRRLVSSACS